jgi:hypothetical protein
MRTLIFFICITITTTVFGNTPKPKVYHPVRAHRIGDIFFFKVDCYFRGANVEVYNENGVKIFERKITQKNKALLDFYYETPGTYKIVITKGSEVENFSFVKVKSNLTDVEQQESVLLTQGL